MKKIVISVMICFVSIFGSAAMVMASTGSSEQSKSESQSAETAEPEIEDDGDVSYVLAEEAAVLEKHAELIDYLITEDYSAAEEYIHKLVLDQMEEQASDIGEHLTKVEITSENFEDYFELVKIPRYNGFGEVIPDHVGFGLKSKKYDEGLIVYSCDRIYFDYNENGQSGLSGDIETFLYCGNSILGGYDIDTFSVSYGGSVTGGYITFIDKDYIESYTIPEKESPADDCVTAEILLKNGETLYHVVCPEYPY